MSTADARKPVPVVSVNSDGTALDPKSIAVRWLLGQEASTVALFLIGACGIYGTWWHMTVGAPAADANRSAVYQRLIESTNTTQEKVATQNAAALDKLQATFEKTMDRIERRSAKERE